MGLFKRRGSTPPASGRTSNHSPDAQAHQTPGEPDIYLAAFDASILVARENNGVWTSHLIFDDGLVLDELSANSKNELLALEAAKSFKASPLKPSEDFAVFLDAYRRAEGL